MRVLAAADRARIEPIKLRHDLDKWRFQRDLIGISQDEKAGLDDQFADGRQIE